MVDQVAPEWFFSLSTSVFPLVSLYQCSIFWWYVYNVDGLFSCLRQLLFISELESYSGRANHAAQVSSEMLDKNRYPDPPGWGLSLSLTCWLHKNSTVSKLQQSWRPWPENRTKLHRGTMLHIHLSLMLYIISKWQHEITHFKKSTACYQSKIYGYWQL